MRAGLLHRDTPGAPPLPGVFGTAVQASAEDAGAVVSSRSAVPMKIRLPHVHGRRELADHAGRVDVADPTVPTSVTEKQSASVRSSSPTNCAGSAAAMTA